MELSVRGVIEKAILLTLVLIQRMVHLRIVVMEEATFMEDMTRVVHSARKALTFKMKIIMRRT